MLVIPGLFAITDRVIGNPQMATFAAFGGFATLVLASFGGTRREKLICHCALALAGSVLIIIGTAVNSSVAVAAIVTVPVTFAVFFAGVAGPNASSGVTAALLAYVLPAASPGTMSMVPDRLAGWWLASVAGTAAVLLLSPPNSDDAVRRAASNLAAALANGIDAILRGERSEDDLAACVDAKHELLSRFNTTVIAPTGIGTADQALANGVELLEWCSALFTDMVHERSDVSGADAADRELLAVCATVLRESGSLFAGADRWPDLDRLEQCRRDSIMRLHGLAPDREDFREQAQLSFHAQALAVTALVIGADALVAGRKVNADWVAEQRIRWFGDPTLGPGGGRNLSGLAKYSGIARPARERAVRLVHQQPARIAGARRRGARRRSQQRPTRVLGRVRNPVGAAHERRLDRFDGAPSAGRDRGRLRHRGRADRGDRNGYVRTLGGTADRAGGCRLFTRDRAVRRRTGGVHRDDRRTVQPDRPGRVEGRGRADRGCRARMRGQRRRRHALLAPGRLVGGR